MNPKLPPQSLLEASTVLRNLADRHGSTGPMPTRQTTRAIVTTVANCIDFYINRDLANILLPCPFCGSRPRLRHPGPLQNLVICSKGRCILSSGGMTVDQWQTRSPGTTAP